MRSLEGKEANRKIMHNASSMSRTASVKVGYLQNFDHGWVFRLEDHRISPFLDNMV